jgi:hypothetical protein
LGKESGVIQLKNHRSPGGQRFANAKSERAKVALGNDEDGDADEELWQDQWPKMGQEMYAN